MVSNEKYEVNCCMHKEHLNGFLAISKRWIRNIMIYGVRRGRNGLRCQACHIVRPIKEAFWGKLKPSFPIYEKKVSK